MKLKNKYAKQNIYSNQKFEDQMWYKKRLAVWIFPPIALPRALPIVTEWGVLEAAMIRSGASKSVASAVGLVGTPATIEAAPAAARIAKSLALRIKSRRWNVGYG